jgi:hypothetical protein
MPFSLDTNFPAPRIAAEILCVSKDWSEKPEMCAQRKTKQTLVPGEYCRFPSHP